MTNEAWFKIKGDVEVCEESCRDCPVHIVSELLRVQAEAFGGVEIHQWRKDGGLGRFLEKLAVEVSGIKIASIELHTNLLRGGSSFWVDVICIGPDNSTSCRMSRDGKGVRGSILTGIPR